MTYRATMKSGTKTLFAAILAVASLGGQTAEKMLKVEMPPGLPGVEIVSAPLVTLPGGINYNRKNKGLSARIRNRWHSTRLS